MPSASVMMREIRMPVCVESKKRTGRRSTCACTRRRMSAIARCAATPSTCDSANEVAACTTRGDARRERQHAEQLGPLPS